MAVFAKEILPISIEEELKHSYLDYAMSVIVGRALPDVRDGLKPVHRRVLHAMNVLGNDYNKPYKKSARVVGDVIGKYHPHGDTAVYDTIVRMAQPFSLRYLLIDGQGNFGSVDGDAPAAMRYTEIRMAKIAHEMLADLDKETVDFAPNYDNSETEPVVLPARLPNLLVNGSSGIAVGMATNIPPHNLSEVIDGCLALMDNPELGVAELLQYIPGPDFPTAAIIQGRAGIISAYQTGRGKVYLRPRYHIETNEKSDKESIIVTELPYQVNKARLIERIAELVKDKKIEGITALRDESDKDGMRIVIELRRGELSEVILNNLYAQTALQTVFGINMVALDNGQPKLFTLKEMLEAFIRHRREVVTRRSIYELRKARERAHLVEGLAIALTNIDRIIELVKTSPTPAIAKERLLAESFVIGNVAMLLKDHAVDSMRPDDLPVEYGFRDERYYLSPAQAQAILDLRLHRLTGLEQDKLIAEFKELIAIIEDLLDILGSTARLMQVIRDELLQIKQQYSDKRRSEITHEAIDLSMEDLIAPQDVVVTLSHEGYIKYQPMTSYEAQRRGGKGKAATKMKEDDFVTKLLIANTHDTLLCFSNMGKLYWLKVYLIPEASRQARGRPIVNLLSLAENERITVILPVRDYVDGHFVFMTTQSGVVKKTALSEFSRPRSNGIIALDLVEGDQLISAAITDGSRHIMLFNDAGKAIRFHEEDVRVMGRQARGVRGIRLREGQKVMAAILAQEQGEVLTVTANGYGKCTPMSEYSLQGRGGQGVIAIQTSARNGRLVGAVPVQRGEQIMLISDQGTLVRTRVDEIAVVGRNTQGVRLIRLSENEHLVGLQSIAEDESDESGAEE